MAADDAMGGEGAEGAAAAGGGFLKIAEVEPRWHKVKLVPAPAASRASDDPKVWEVVSRPDADSVAVMLYVRSSAQIVLVERFRAGAAVAQRGGDGRILETVAAAAPAAQSASLPALRDRAREVLADQTGYLVPASDIHLVASFYPSPGASDERVHLYFAEAPDPLAPPASRSADSAVALNPRVLHYDLVEFFTWLERQEEDPDALIDAKVLLGAQELRRRLAMKSAQEAQLAKERMERERPFEIEDFRRPCRFAPPQDYSPDGEAAAALEGLRIVLHRGDIADVKGVDIWVNSENTAFEMDQRLGRSISARIRALGAHVGSDQQPLEDTIWIDLLRRRRTLARRPIASVIETTPGALNKSNGVKRLLHVAAVEASASGIKYARLLDVRACVETALAVADRPSRFHVMPLRGRSVLFPMIGSGNGDRSVGEIFELMMTGVVRYFGGPRPRRAMLERVHFIAYSAEDYFTVLDRLAKLGAAYDGEFDPDAEDAAPLRGVGAA